MYPIKILSSNLKETGRDEFVFSRTEEGKQ